MSGPTLELHIEELMLTGFEPGDQWRMASVMRLTLAQLVEQHGVPPSLVAGVVPATTDRGNSVVSVEGDIYAIGVGLGHAIYERLTLGQAAFGAHRAPHLVPGRERQMR